jgi:hypothetical protein
MVSNYSLYTKIEMLPERLKKEVSDYIDLILNKNYAPDPNIVAGFGSAKGKITMAEDFDAPIDAFKDYM